MFTQWWLISILRCDTTLQIPQMYRTRTNFRGTYISRMPQIQHFRDFIFEDHRILYWYIMWALY